MTGHKPFKDIPMKSDPDNAKDALMALNSGYRKTINPTGGRKATEDYCDRKFTLYCALEAHKETIRKALQRMIDDNANKSTTDTDNGIKTKM